MRNKSQLYSAIFIGFALLLASSLSACKTMPAQPSSTNENLPRAQLVEAKVVRVVDGDTIQVDINGHLYKVRYIGIDTPETVHPTKPVEYFGKEASEKNRELVEGETVLLEKDVSEVDKYGRLLRYVWVDDVMVNAELVRLGYAQVVTYPPDVKYQEYFLQLQKEAQEAGLGLWAEALPPAPSASNVQITYIFYDGLVPRVESDEYVEITNLGDTSEDLEGWVLKDIDEGYPSHFRPMS